MGTTGNKRVKGPDQSRFASIESATVPRSSFDRSSGLKTAFDGGLLIPIFLDEALPGDTFNLKMNAFARLATPIKPILDNLYLETFWFAVPYRLLWDNWEKFMGEQENPGDSIDYLVPQIDSSLVVSIRSIYDYMGLPFGAIGSVSALPFRAYNLIWNEWFRDENVVDSRTVPKDDGPDAWTTYNLASRMKRHDYFTSCLPWPQKGAAVTLPLGDKAPVTGLVNAGQTYAAGAGTVYETGATSGRAGLDYIDTATGANVRVEEDPNNAGFPGVWADLSSATASTINELRQAFQIQRLLERDARGGTRYPELLRSHFGVISPDSRLQRPEFLGSGSSPINITPIAQTTSTDATTPQGNLAAMGTSAPVGHGFTKSFTEHCLVLGLVQVRADLTYQQGIDRMWNRSTRYDFYWPALAHIGEQAVLSKEIYADGSANDADVFGYQERYAEYRYKPSRICGEFRSAAAAPLDFWHLSQDFTTSPVLDENFMTDKPPIDRVIAVQTEPHMLFDAHFSLRCARPMPLYGVPGMVDHF